MNLRPTDELILRRLGPEDEQAFFDGLKAFQGEELDWYTFDWKQGISFSTHLEKLQKNEKGEDLPPGFVSNTMLYGFVQQQIVGRLHIRHELTQKLRVRGGHIGYAVAPRWRGLGYATQMLRSGLKECQLLGLKEVLLTCAQKNSASWKVIEKVTSQEFTTSVDPETQEALRHYWVKLER